MNYHAGTFRDLSETPLGIEVWELLNTPEAIAALETASRLGKPAVQGVEELLLQRFGEQILDHRIKQMIGHMVRQIMERRGWRLDQAEVKVHSVPFIKGARYRRGDSVDLFAFRNSADPRDVAVTATREATGLPREHRWTFYASIDSRLKAAVFGLPNLDLVLQDIEENGFHRVLLERMLRAAR